jgi:DNA repair protein RadC
MIMETLMNESWNQIAEVELIYKTKIKSSERPQVKTSRESADLLKQMWNEDKIDFVKQFKVLLLNRANKSWELLSFQLVVLPER